MLRCKGNLLSYAQSIFIATPIPKAKPNHSTAPHRVWAYCAHIVATCFARLYRRAFRHSWRYTHDDRYLHGPNDKGEHFLRWLPPFLLLQRPHKPCSSRGELTFQWVWFFRTGASWHACINPSSQLSRASPPPLCIASRIVPKRIIAPILIISSDCIVSRRHSHFFAGYITFHVAHGDAMGSASTYLLEVGVRRWPEGHGSGSADRHCIHASMRG
jgi:hypothetical protein